MPTASHERGRSFSQRNVPGSILPASSDRANRHAICTNIANLEHDVLDAMAIVVAQVGAEVWIQKVSSEDALCGLTPTSGERRQWGMLHTILRLEVGFPVDATATCSRLRVLAYASRQENQEYSYRKVWWGVSYSTGRKQQHRQRCDCTKLSKDRDRPPSPPMLDCRSRLVLSYAENHSNSRRY